MSLSEATAPAKLKAGLGLIDVVMLGAGTAIGAAIFSVLGPATQIGGAGILITVVLAAAPMILFALVYAYMASAAPRTAASYEWQRQFTNPLFAFSIVWLRVLSNAVVMIVLARVLVNYLGMVLAVPAAPFIFAVFTLVFVLNFVGIAIAARAQTVMMLLLLIVFAIFVASGARFWRFDLLQAAASDWRAVIAALPLMIQLFLGIETATEVGEEVRDSKSTVPKAIGLALLLTVTVYFSVSFTALSLAGPTAIAASSAPLIEAASHSLGGWATPLIASAAILALSKSLNAVFLVFARFLFAMGRSGVLPAALGRVHPRFGTPHVATIVAYVAAVAGLLLPSSLVFLLIAVSVPTMLKYFGSCLAAYSVATNHPEIAQQARIQFSPATVKVLAVLGALAAIVIAGLGLGTDWRPYALLTVWLGLGLAYYALSHRGRDAAAQRGERSGL